MPNLREPSTIRWSDEDKAIMARLRARLAMDSDSAVVRFAIRYLDQYGPLQGKGEGNAQPNRDHTA